MPLADCAPLVVAHEVGFASSEGLDLTLHRASSWSALRDNLAAGRLAAAHMLAPVPVAASIGIGRVAGRLDALSVLSVNGNVIGVSTELAARLHGHLDDFMAADTVGRRLVSCCRRPLRVGVPFPYSMHVELLTYWLGALGMSAPADLEIQTVPPPRMAGAVGAGEIDMFIVGEPWGSIAVEAGAAELILPGAAIWQFAPEKVLAVRHDWVQAEPEIAARLLRAVWRAGRWAAELRPLLLGRSRSGRRQQGQARRGCHEPRRAERNVRFLHVVPSGCGSSPGAAGPAGEVLKQKRRGPRNPRRPGRRNRARMAACSGGGGPHGT